MYHHIRVIITFLFLSHFWIASQAFTNENLGEFNNARVQDISQFQGLSSSKIKVIFKDKKGFVWIGTDNGLNRYDGKSIIVFQHDPNNKFSIGHDEIQTIYEDKNNQLWIGTRGGLYVFDPVKQTFVLRKISNSSTNTINAICEDLEGKIWVSTTTGIFKYNFEDDTFQKIEFVDLENGSPIVSVKLYPDKNGDIWIGTWDKGVFRMNPTTGAYEKFLPSNLNSENHQIYSEGQVADIAEGPDGSIWFGCWNLGILKINPDRKTSKVFSHKHDNPNSLNGNKVKALSFDHLGYLWIGIEESGLDRLAPVSETFTHYLNDFQGSGTTEGPSIYSIMTDDQSLLWLGFRNDGLKIIPLEDLPFAVFSKGDKYKGIFGFCETEQGIFIGSKSTIDIFNRRKKTFESFSIPNKETPISIYSFDENTLLVGTYTGTIYRFDQSKKIFNEFINEELYEQLKNSKIECFYKINNEEVLVGTQQGVFRINLLENSFKKIIKGWTHEFFAGKQESIWGLEWGSFYQYFPNTGKIIEYETDAKGDIKSCYITPDNKTIYLGTDLGFYKQDINSTKAERFEEIVPFGNNQVNSIAVDNQNNFWITSEENLIFYNKAKNKFRIFNEEDGIPPMRFYDGVGLKLKNGKIIFGGDQGMLMFDPLKIEDKENIANLTLTGLTILNENITASSKNSPFDKDISELDELTLEHNQNIITFHFALLSYINPKKHKYRYQLAGFNDKWFDIGNQKSLTFTNLDAGNYTLKIQAANEENNWTPIQSIQIAVSPPIYQTWYAYVLYGLLGIGVFYITKQFYSNREKLKSKLKDEHVNFEKMKAKAVHESEFSQMRLKFFTNISHEFRTPLTLILGPLENFIKHQKSPSEDHLKLMYKNAERLQRLINQILDFRSMESKSLKIELSWGNVTQFVKDTAKLFIPMAEQKGLKFILTDNTQNLNAWFDRDKVEKIIYNLLSNAHKHTQDGKIEFILNTYTRDSLTYSSEKWDTEEYSIFLEMIIRDSGEGIPEKKISQIFNRFYHLQSNDTGVQGTGIGLSLTKELLELHNGKIYVSSELKKGSEFKVVIPLVTKRKEEEQLIPAQQNEEKENLSILKENNEEESVTLLTPEEYKPTVLIVEDNEDLRQYMKVEFGSNYHIIEADNGANGLEVALNEIPDLIISDLMMPKMDGIELCKALKQDERTSHVPIIILTAHTSQFNQVRGYEIGADDYITKPFSSELLSLRIENLLKVRKELQSKFSREVRLEPKNLQISSMDERFLTKAMEVVEENLNDSEFNADAFASEMCMSRVHLYRKLKALTDQSVSDFVKTARLKLAANLIGENKLTIKEAAYSVGFKDPKYFSKCFKQQFGVKPSEYQPEEIRENKDDIAD